MTIQNIQTHPLSQHILVASNLGNTLCVSVVCCCQSLAQQALMGTINSSMQAVQQAQVDLGHVDNLPPLGHDLVRLLSSYFTILKKI